MNLRLKATVIALVLVFCGYGLWPSLQYYGLSNPEWQKTKRINLGLDLQGGMYLDLEVDTEMAKLRLLDRLANQVEDLLLDELINYVSIERMGNAVEVVLSKDENVDWDKAPFDSLSRQFALLPLPNGMRFTLLQTESERIETESIDQALEVLRNRIDSLGVSEPSLQKQGSQNLVVQLPGLKDRESALAAIGTQAVLEFYMVVENIQPTAINPYKHVVKYQDIENEQGRYQQPFVLEKRAILSGETVQDARLQISTYDNNPYVSITFNATGAERFERITKNNRGRRLAIVLDSKVQSAPVIRETISGGTAQISGQFSMQEATNLSIVLRSGALPAPLIIREERTVGASLGEDSIRAGVLSLLIGIALVMGFIGFYYRVAGVIAAMMLTFNLIIILAVLAAFQATLTLPGIAGIVLTMGISVDANVLIFERIREELPGARSPRAAVMQGFARTFWSIADANITTLVAAFALLTFGSGPIKGFAITLAIGILSSMFTAIFVSRFMFELIYLRKRNLEKVHI